MGKRNVLIVGSLPFENETMAMDHALTTFQGDLMGLPDGEIGEKSNRYPNGDRSAWAMVAIDQCIADDNHWEVIQKGKLGENGFPLDYDTLYKVRPKHAPEVIGKHLNFHYHEFFERNYPIFQQLREDHHVRDLPFQVGVPTGMALVLHMLEEDQLNTYYSLFNQRLAYEVNEIVRIAGEDVTIQIEIPAETALVYQGQADLAMESVLHLVRNIHPPVTIGIHMCYGDLNNTSLTHPLSLEPMVAFIHQLIDHWPRTHQLGYIHLPLAEGNIPPKLEKTFYLPLKKLQIPETTRIVAGLVHERREIAELKAILATIETLCGRTIDVACACGMGRRSKATSMQLMEVTKQLLNT
ncbi:hypothetical protein [Thalassobacillus pellis]|uniref:hypothetical protein n=1 Tax=Thalassobacillus pellis TaxID=748008 RepID=UPI0019602EBE|nr:hypothetical protein [Thalassobacillus pellis]MBM7554562.1 hypothetical protein [Thalassobacillus pellis]